MNNFEGGCVGVGYRPSMSYSAEPDPMGSHERGMFGVGVGWSVIEWRLMGWYEQIPDIIMRPSITPQTLALGEPLLMSRDGQDLSVVC